MYNFSVHHLHARLQKIRTQVGLDAIYVCLVNRHIKQFKILSQSTLHDDAYEINQGKILEWLSTVEDTAAHTTLNLPSRATVWARLIGEEVFGVVILYGDASVDVDSLAFWVDISQTSIENYYLSEQFVDADSLAKAIHLIAPDPSPQNVIHALRNHIFNEHVSGCLILTYHPIRERYSKAPHSHLKIVGSWSQNLGDNIGVGQLLELDVSSRILAQLQQDKFIVYDDIEELKKRQTNPLIHKLINADDIKSVTLIALDAEQHSLGIVGIATSIPYELTSYELKKYRIISEFLMLNTLTAVLQKQGDFVMECRATLLDSVKDAVVMLLMDMDGTVLTVNQQFVKMFDLYEAKVLGIPLDELLDKMHLPTDVRQDLREKWQSSLQMNSHGEFSMVSMQGIQSDIEWYSRLMYRQGELIGKIYTLHDITPQRVADRLRRKLLSRISHELRTPLTAIRGFSRFILDEESENLTKLAHEYIEIIHESAVSLNSLIDDAIEITRADMGEVTLAMEKTSLCELVNDVVRHVKIPQEVMVACHDGELQVNLDVERIRRVIVNLLHNASKYSPIDTVVKVKVDYVESDYEFAPTDLVTPCIIVAIIDQGEGISVQDVEMVFLPFYRTEAPQKQQIAGIGLGLAISRSIIEMHRGKIWVQPASSEYPGGRFFFSIPTS